MANRYGNAWYTTHETRDRQEAVDYVTKRKEADEYGHEEWKIVKGKDGYYKCMMRESMAGYQNRWRK